jgi:hypothetical protein
MLIYLSSLHTRASILFANSFQQETANNSTIRLFDANDIYNIVLVQKPHILLIEQELLSNLHILNFFQDLVNNNLDIGHTQVIVLGNNSTFSYKHTNIKYLSPDLYISYNEYVNASDNLAAGGYLLCSLNCTNLEINKLLEPIIYPTNKTIPVKLVNCPQINHIQNLGLADEATMLKLIADCYAYINLDNQYVYDAMLLNKPIINLIDNSHLPLSSSDSIIENMFVEYDITNIKKYKISNIVKHIINK